MMRRHVTKSRRCEMGCEAVGAGIPGQQTEAKWKERFCEGCLLSAPGPSGRGTALARVGKGRCRQRQRRGNGVAHSAGRNNPMIAIKRAYEPRGRGDGTRILVDRLWPRGVKKEQAHIEKWMRELGPSNELRRFFGHDPERWEEFRKRYRAELRRSEAKSLLDELLEVARKDKLTLVYSARDEQHNQAVVLKEVLDAKL